MLAHYQTLLMPEDGAESPIQLDAAPTSAQVDVAETYDWIACIHDLERSDLHLLPGVTHIGRELGYSALAFVRTANSNCMEFAQWLEFIPGCVAK